MGFVDFRQPFSECAAFFFGQQFDEIVQYSLLVDRPSLQESPLAFEGQSAGRQHDPIRQLAHPKLFARGLIQGDEHIVPCEGNAMPVGQVFLDPPDDRSGKQAVLIQSSGDIYSDGSLRDFEHGSRYLKSVLSFIGVERIETIYMESMDQGAAQAEARRLEALKEASLAVQRLSL